MGKAKRRGFNLQQKNQYTNISRADAITEAIRLYEIGQDAGYLVGGYL